MPGTYSVRRQQPQDLAQDWTCGSSRLVPARGEGDELHRERAEEAREAREAHDVPSLLEGLRQHCLSDHREHGTCREALHAGDDQFGGGVVVGARREEHGSDGGAQGRQEGDGPPHQQDVPHLNAVGLHAAGRAHALGQVAEEDADDEGQRGLRGGGARVGGGGLVDEDAYDQGLRHGVDEDAEPDHDRSVLVLVVGRGRRRTFKRGDHAVFAFGDGGCLLAVRRLGVRTRGRGDRLHLRASHGVPDHRADPHRGL
mmetsp:Transcript_99278/g.241450  ORF Transcript_99278/g.241450 Transcript_99278/m.241450 type:complete len:256 (+) Transcript_99278:178-945(+)